MDGAACVQLCSDPPIFKYKLTALTFRICLVYRHFGRKWCLQLASCGPNQQVPLRRQ